MSTALSRRHALPESLKKQSIDFYRFFPQATASRALPLNKRGFPPSSRVSEVSGPEWNIAGELARPSYRFVGFYHSSLNGCGDDLRDNGGLAFGEAEAFAQ
jgi:hypothetical protein